MAALMLTLVSTEFQTSVGLSLHRSTQDGATVCRAERSSYLSLEVVVFVFMLLSCIHLCVPAKVKDVVSHEAANTWAGIFYL